MNDVAVVVFACSAEPYRSCWQPTADLLERFWKDRPWPLYLAADRIAGTVVGYDRMIETGAPRREWGRHVQAACRMIQERWLLVLLDDYFACGRWDTARLLACAAALETKCASYCRVVPTPGPDVLMDSEGFGIHSPGKPYRTSLQPAFWDREYLGTLARRASDPWSFETQLDGDPARLHLSVTREARYIPVSYTNALIRGQRQSEAEALCSREGIPWSLSS